MHPWLALCCTTLDELCARRVPIPPVRLVIGAKPLALCVSTAGRFEFQAAGAAPPRASGRFFVSGPAPPPGPPQSVKESVARLEGREPGEEREGRSRLSGDEGVEVYFRDGAVLDGIAHKVRAHMRRANGVDGGEAAPADADGSLLSLLFNILAVSFLPAWLAQTADPAVELRAGTRALVRFLRAAWAHGRREVEAP